MSSPGDHPHEKAGIFYASAAYATWAVMPLYWRIFNHVNPYELTTHRVFWCAIFCAIVTLARRRIAHIIGIIKRPRVLFALVATSILITINWTIFIYSVAAHQLVDSALGYYLTPLVSIALGVLVLGEKISAMRIAAIALATTAVIIKSIDLGHFPWIAPALALTFGFYGYLRK